MRKALLLGDRVAPYHPVGGIYEVLKRIYDGVFDITLDENYGELTLDVLKQYDMVISYMDGWGEKGTKQAAAALVAYVADGGSLLVLHNGLVAAGSSHELALLYGARFLWHPSQVLIDYYKTDVDHQISERFEEFRTTEEAYMFDFDDFTRKQVLVEYRYANSRIPAVWCHRYGWGKVVCVVSGHQTESLHAPVRKILYRAGLWFLDRI